MHISGSFSSNFLQSIFLFYNGPLTTYHKVLNNSNLLTIDNNKMLNMFIKHQQIEPFFMSNL